jgi:EAL and modified HD-GYP domain-containing signal transduction protein
MTRSTSEKSVAKEKDSPAKHGIFFTRQPILDAKRSIWGYELLGGEIKEGIFEVFPQQESVAGLSSGTYLGLQEAMERGKKIMVGFDDASVLSGVPYALPPASGVVRLLSGRVRAVGLDEVLQNLRSEGYRTVLDVTPGNPMPTDICDLADIFAFDLSKSNPDRAFLDLMHERETEVLARGVKTVQQFESARDLGFDLFQGPFFKEAECIRSRKLSSNAVARLNLLRLMEAEDPDVKVLGEAIRSDVSISFRLLSYLNSAWFGLRQSVQSIDQAVMMLGWLKLRGWLRAVLIVDMAGREEVPQELAALSLQRAKLLELLATEYDYWGFNPSTLFLMGLFSLMDAILGMPMGDVVELLPLDTKLKAALRRDPNNEYRPLFELLASLEDGDWPGLEALTRRLFMDLGRIKDIFAQARDWAAGFFAVRN